MVTNDVINKTQTVSIFRDLFSGHPHVYGTYDPVTGKARVVKAQVTDKVIWDHIKGIKPYGVFLLVKDKVWATAVDFDTKNRIAPASFVFRSKHYGLPVYIERSKSKGYHCWIFFDKNGVIAQKARLVVNFILEDIEEYNVEVFPKQDTLGENVRFGNYINTPLFGQLVPKEKSVFIDPATFKPYHDQWMFLKSVEKVSESVLDEVIEINELTISLPYHPSLPADNTPSKDVNVKNTYSLPPCARKMLHGVSKYQRVSCFRLAVHLKRLGLPFDHSIAVLKIWALKNRPKNGKSVIRESEILSQTASAYNNSYIGYGCNSEAVKPFCDHFCPVMKRLNDNKKESYDINKQIQ